MQQIGSEHHLQHKRIIPLLPTPPPPIPDSALHPPTPFPPLPPSHLSATPHLLPQF